MLNIESFEIDWHDQWQQHAYGFKDGHAHIHFKELGLKNEGSIVLAPGPGFGDLSHPTTHLVLSMMSPYVCDKEVLDVGSGSGILSLAAARFGAKSVFGIDIDDAAILHATQNASLNNLSKLCTFGKKQKKEPAIMLMNMIRSEQKVAYKSLKHKNFEIACTSGVLAEERELYLKETASWGWKLLDIQEKDGWLGFVFR